MHSQTRARTSVLSAGAITATAALIALSTAAYAGQSDPPPHHRFTIPAERLEAALTAFSAQAHLRVVTSGVRGDVLSPGVSGDLSSLSALSALLRATGMSYRERDAQTVVVVPEQVARLRPTQFQLIGDTNQDALADQPAAPAQASSASELSEVQVTGTRIIRNGYEAPTPVSTIGLSELQDQAAPNYASVIEEMPMFQGSATPDTGGISDGPGGGENNLNLRDLGTNRVLVLFDGRRYPSESTNVVDVGMIPDALVSRVDVVTGGASAVYGSDALSGVVNYVLNTNFNGIQGLVQGGVSSQGDGGNDEVQFTAGTPFADGRGHFEISADQEYQAEIQGTARTWNMQGFGFIQNPTYTTNKGAPELIDAYNVGLVAGNPGGIIAGGPLKGTAFGAGGTPFQWDYGNLQSGEYQVGGDWLTSTMDGAQAIVAGTNQTHLFADLRYSFNDNVTVYAQFNDGQMHANEHCCYDYYLGNLTVYANNPYLPTSVAAQAAADGVTSMAYGMTVRDPSRGLGDMNTSYNNVYVLGAEGKFNLFQSAWNWNVYSQEGLATETVFVPYQALTANFMNAIDAVRVGSYGGPYTAAAYPNPSGIAAGTITCASNLLPVGAVGQTSNCVPYNVFGTGVNTPAATAYVQSGPWERYTIGQGILGGYATGEPFSDWAGPVSVAVDGEYRKDSIQGVNDPYSNARGWFSTQLNAYDASQYVYEGALETVIPLAKNMPWAKELDANGGARATEYSTSGYVTTYKYGLEYTPITDVRLRAYRSMDIRAPTLNDLFSAPSTNHNTIPDPFKGDQSFPYYQVTLSNPDLKPEKAHETGFGVVYQPVEVPGFALSIDYYDIDVKDVIETVSFTYILTQCYANPASPYCADVSRFTSGPNAGNLNAISAMPANLEELIAKGLDYELDYQKRLTEWVPSWQGTVGFRLTATETLDLITNTGIPGPSETLNAAGTGSVPRWGVFGSLTYQLDKWRFAWTERYDSGVKISDAVIQCSTNCPNPVPGGFQTVNYDRVPTYFLADLSVNFRIFEQDTRTTEAFLAVSNLLNKIPPPYPTQIAGATYAITTNAALYDTIGTMFRAGIRFKL